MSCCLAAILLIYRCIMTVRRVCIFLGIIAPPDEETLTLYRWLARTAATPGRRSVLLLAVVVAATLVVSWGAGFTYT